MSLPNLEYLDVGNAIGFDSMKLPEMRNLRDCNIEFRYGRIDMKNLCDAVTKMPKLQNFQVHGLTEQQSFELTCKAILVATSQEKDVEVCKLDHGDHRRRLKITRKNGHDTASSSGKPVPTVTLFINECDKKTYFDKIRTFVKKNMVHHEMSTIWMKR